MRIFLKILLFPLSLTLSLFVAISSFIIGRAAVLLHILSGLLFLAALMGFSQYFFGWPLGGAGKAYNLEAAIFGAVFAFLLSPYGLPMLSLWLVGKLDELNGAIKSL